MCVMGDNHELKEQIAKQLMKMSSKSAMINKLKFNDFTYIK